MYLNSAMDSSSNFVQFVLLLIVFVAILIVAYFVTRWIGATGNAQLKNKNIKIIEGCRVGQNKFIQIVKVGNKYIVLGIGKEEISYLGEVEEETLIINEEEIKPLPDFYEILSKIKKKSFPNGKN